MVVKAPTKWWLGDTTEKTVTQPTEWWKETQGATTGVSTTTPPTQAPTTQPPMAPVGTHPFGVIPGMQPPIEAAQQLQAEQVAPLPAQPFGVRPVAATKTTILEGPSAQQYYEQLGVPTFETVPFKDEARVFGQTLQHLPRQVGASILSATQGQGGASVVNRDWADVYIAEANEDLDKFVQDIMRLYPSSTHLHEVAQLSRNMAYSITSMGAGLATGVPIAFLPVPGARIAAWVAGTAASGAVAYEMTTYQIMQMYLELKNAEQIEQTGREITLEEENKLKADFHDKAVKYGLWEAVPEAISNLLFGQILMGPLGKMIGGPMAAQIVQKLAMMYGEELLTETITQKGQSAIEVEAGLREERIGWIEAFKEIAPQTFLLTTIMAGAGQVVISSTQGIKKITDSLKTEIGTNHILYNEIKQGIETDIDSVVVTPETVTGVEPTITEAPTVAMAEWEAVSGKPEINLPAKTRQLSQAEQFMREQLFNEGMIDVAIKKKKAIPFVNYEGKLVKGTALEQGVSPEEYTNGVRIRVEGDTFVMEAEALIVPIQGQYLARLSQALTEATISIYPGKGYAPLSEATQQESLAHLERVVRNAKIDAGIEYDPDFSRYVGYPADVLDKIKAAVTKGLGEVTPEVTKPTVEPEALYIPPKLPTIPPPLTPAGTILGRSDNEWGGFMADLQDAQTVADIAFRNDLVRKWANNLPGFRGLFEGLNPQVVANTPAKKAAIVRATLRDEGYQKTQGVIAYLQEIGSQEKIFGELDSKGFIKEGKLKGKTVGDIAGERAKWEARLTDEQRLWLDRAETIEKATVEFLRGNDIDIKLLSLEEGGQFATRRVWGKTLEAGSVIDTAYVGAGVGRLGSRLPTEKHRIFKTETEAIEAGYRYIPYEEALYLKVIGAYNRVADKKMADWLLTKVTWRTTGAPEELILAAESARLKMRHSQMLLAALNRAVRGERLPDVTIRAIATSYPAQAQALKDLIPRLQAAKPSIKEIKNLTNVAKGLIDTNKMNYHKAVAARARAREAAMKVKIGEAVIPAPAFQGKILTGPDAKETARTLRKTFEPSFNKALGQINKANAVARYFMLAGDYSPFTIQLLFLIGENPKIYGRTFGGAVRAMVNSEFHSKFLSKHKVTIDKHPNLLIAKGGTTEFTEAMARGGWLSGKTSFRPEAEPYWKSLSLFLPRAVGKVGGTVLTPFQRVFEYSLDAAGIYMAEAYEHLATTPERTSDIDQFINEFRGLTSSARIGVSGVQRQAETFILLAPRYNRAIAGLLWDLSRGNIRGHLARKSLIKGIAALCAIATAISIARGEDEEEILEHFNPNSSMFFTWDVAGQKIGPGSKIRSLIKLVAQSSANPDELLEFSMDNPALRFVRGNLAPVAGSAIDLITGRSYIGDPTRDGILSFSKEILAGNLLPIWVQSVLMEGGSPGGRTARGLAEFLGGRAYPEPLWDEVRRLRDRYAKQDLNMKYEDLNRAQIDKLKDNHPDLDDLEERARLEQAERGNEFELGFYEIRKEAIAERDTALDEAATLLLAGSISKYDYDKERGYVRPYYSGGMSTLYQMRDRLDPKAIKDIEEWLSENQKPEDKAMDEYQEHRASLIEKADLPRDWDDIEAQCEKFLSKYSKKTQDYIKENLSRWINALPENAKKIELMRLHGIEDETWWDDYRGVAETGPAEWWAAGPEGTTQGPTKWWEAGP